MNLPLKMVLGAATIALMGNLATVAQAADTMAQAAAPIPMAAPAPGTPVTDVQNPKQTLAGAKVQDSKGQAIGQVKSIKLDSNGKVAAIDVAMGTRTVALRASDLTYAPSDNTIISTKSKDELFTQ